MLRAALCALAAGAVAAAVPFSATTSEPGKPVQFIVPSGTGAGASPT
jgi:tripartite-type tricarboxylate transporter receptor subunit TctC